MLSHERADSFLQLHTVPKFRHVTYEKKEKADVTIAIGAFELGHTWVLESALWCLWNSTIRVMTYIQKWCPIIRGARYTSHLFLSVRRVEIFWCLQGLLPHTVSRRNYPESADRCACRNIVHSIISSYPVPATFTLARHVRQCLRVLHCVTLECRSMLQKLGAWAKCNITT